MLESVIHVNPPNAGGGSAGDSHVIVLAAGRGSRMGAARPKVLHRLAGRPLIGHVLRAASALAPATTTVVVGHQAEAVMQAVGSGPRFVRQARQLGTAHALLQAEPALRGSLGRLVVLSGDVPRIRPETLRRLLAAHAAAGAAATVLTAELDCPRGYGRVIRRGGRFGGIVEQTEATPAQQAVREVNSGIYVFDPGPLFAALRRIPEAGPRRERYLPAVLDIYRREGLTVETAAAGHPNEIRGINSQAELAEASRIMRQEKSEELLAAGVTLEDPATTYVDDEVRVGPDTIIHPGVTLEGGTTIGARCELHSSVRIIDSAVGDDVTVENCCVIRGARVEAGGRVGPFAHLRPGTVVGETARVGNFVELKKAALGRGVKANHLSYVGDATLGEGVNIGAGTITCNYDGTSKHPTTVEDGAFIGSGTQLVAPVTVGRGAYVAAGTCVTRDVPADALAVGRAPQENKPDWAARKRRPAKRA